MATLLDLGLLGHFSIIFPMLLVYGLVIGVLSYTKLFGDSKQINNIIAIALAISVSLSTSVVQIINTMSPWIVLIFIFIMFLLMAYKFMGATDSDIHHVLMKDKTIVVWIIIIFFIIMLGSMGKLFFAGTTTTTTTDGNTTISSSQAAGTGVGAFWATLFNAKVLGVIMVMMIAVFAIILLSHEELTK
jgi:hypothetical protein